MTKILNIRSFAVSAVVALATGVSSASAATVLYTTFVTGENLGAGSQATLEYKQNGNNVDFWLTNTLNSVATAFIGAIGFTYNGAKPTVVKELAGSQAFVAGLGSQSLGGPFSIDFGVQIGGKGQDKNELVVGETALFRILGVTASNFDFSFNKTAIHAQGLSGGGSTKYTISNDGNTGGPSPVPVPGALSLLLSALGVVAFVRQRRA